MDNQDYLRRWERYRRNRANKWYGEVKRALDNQVKQFLERRMLTDVTATELTATIKDLYKDVGEGWANQTRLNLRGVKNRRPMGFSVEIIELMLQYFGDAFFLNMCEDMTQTTRDQIAEVLSRAAIIGEDFDWITAQLLARSFTAVRARLIARTETVAAANRASMIQADRYDFLVDKVWLSVQDRRTRDGIPSREKDHLHMNNVSVPMGQPFNVSGELMDAPGDKGGENGRLPVSAGNVCNCRCTLRYQPRRDANGRLILKPGVV